MVSSIPNVIKAINSGQPPLEAPILGIETATRTCAVAIADNDLLVAESRVNIKNLHARIVVTLIERLLRDCNLHVSRLAAVAVSIGPGSFTGLRIGLSVAKGLVMAHDVPLIPVPTMDALAAQAPIENGIICPVLPCKANEVYMALYRRNRFQNEQIKNVRIIERNALTECVPSEAWIMGDLKGLDPERHRLVPESIALPSAFQVARLAEPGLSTTLADADTLEPTYIQNFVAGKPKQLFPK